MEVKPVVDIGKLRWGGRGCLWMAAVPAAMGAAWLAGLI